MKRWITALVAGALLAAGCTGTGDGPKEDRPDTRLAADQCKVPPAPVFPKSNTITVIACTVPQGKRAHLALDGTVDGQRLPSLEGGPPLPIDIVETTPYAKVFKYPKGSIATLNASVYVVEEGTAYVFCRVLDNNKDVPVADSPQVPVSGPNSRATCIYTTSGR